MKKHIFALLFSLICLSLYAASIPLPDASWQVVQKRNAQGIASTTENGAVTVTGFTGEPEKKSGVTFVVLEHRLPQAMNGDFTLLIDFEWDELDNAFMGEVMLQAIGADGKMLATCGLADSWIAYPGRGLAHAGDIRPKGKAVHTFPLKARAPLSITRIGKAYTSKLSTLTLDKSEGTDLPLAAIRLVFQQANYKGNATLPPSHFGKFTLHSLSLDAAVSSQAANQGKPRAPWKVGEPIVWYWAGPDMSDEFAAELAAGGWNVAFGRNVFDLDIMHRHGLRGVLWMPVTPDTPERVEQLKLWLDSVRNHPALYGISCGDEPGYGERMLKAQARVNFLIENAPEILHFNNMYPYGASNAQLGHSGAPTQAYLAHIDEYFTRLKPQLLSYDHYTFFKDGDRGTYFVNQRIIRNAARKLGIPTMNIVQGCAWTPALRVPTPEEYRYLAFTSLAYGSQGLSCYVYSYRGHWGSMRDPVTKKTGPLYEAAKTINRDFKAIATELQPLRTLRAAHAGELPFGADALDEKCQFRLVPAPKNVSQGLWEPQGPGAAGDNFFNLRPPVKGFLVGVFGKDNEHATHALVVNLDYTKEASTTLAAPSKLERFDPATKKWTIAGQEAKLVIPAGSGILLRLADGKTCAAGPENDLGRTLAPPPDKNAPQPNGGFTDKFLSGTLAPQWSRDYRVKCAGINLRMRPKGGLDILGLDKPEAKDACAALDRTMPPREGKFWCEIPFSLEAPLPAGSEISFSISTPNGERLAGVTFANGKATALHGHTSKVISEKSTELKTGEGTLVIRRVNDTMIIRCYGVEIYKGKCDTAPAANFRILIRGAETKITLRTAMLM